MGALTEAEEALVSEYEKLRMGPHLTALVRRLVGRVEALEEALETARCALESPTFPSLKGSETVKAVRAALQSPTEKTGCPVPNPGITNKPDVQSQATGRLVHDTDRSPTAPRENTTRWHLCFHDTLKSACPQCAPTDPTESPSTVKGPTNSGTNSSGATRCALCGEHPAAHGIDMECPGRTYRAGTTPTSEESE